MSTFTSPSPQQFADTPFDVLIVGAGTAALPIAAKTGRLSADPRITVGVLEAGAKHTADPLIDTPQFLGRTTGQPAYDWGFASAPQAHALGRSIPFPRGKGVGGSSLINYLAWDRASAPEYDAWAATAPPPTAPGDAWDFAHLLPYFRAAERAAPAATNPNTYPSLVPEARVVHAGEDGEGREGAVATSYNSLYPEIIPPYLRAWAALGAPLNTNPWGGHAAGLYNVRRSVDPATGARASADSAYLTPAVLGRGNLHILTGAQATKVLLKDEKDAAGNVVATGVEFVHDGKTYAAHARKEVVLSAGVVQTPQLLELSGIGAAKDGNGIQGTGIPVRVALPGVGENVQDHLFVPMQFLLKPGTRTFDALRNDPAFLAAQQAEYDATRTGWLAAIDSTVAYTPLALATTPPQFSAILARLEAAIAQGELTPLQKEQYRVQVELLKKGEVPALETLLMSKGFIAPEAGKSYFILMTGLQHPFSRGSVHIASADPLAAPVIDPNFLSSEFDVEALLAGYRLMEKVVAQAPLAGLIAAQQLPPAVLEADEHALGFIRAAATTGAHLMGSCALARRDLGGVVGNDLRVHGTANLRVADASIIPLSVGCHIQATVFAIGERAGDLIKRDL
ncbi:hypothetical protein HWV62_19243 [Athelia sp. TMB]|nr:hypothetical protein HWV62_19243 [Athelia sp. TMB]